MQSGFIQLKSSQFHYSYTGRGSRILLCLHGYGESEKSFHFLEKYVGDKYTIVAIDLPYHGKTSWKEKEAVTIDDLLLVINSVCTELDLQTDSLTLLGFSMGGRVALELLQKKPATIKKMVLLAPDGLKVNFWYWLATQTAVGMKLFRFTMQYPGWFFLLLRAGNVIGVINRSIYKFIKHSIHDKTVRRQLYERWTCMRKIKPRPDLIKQQILKYNIPVRLLYGQHDRIIRYERGEKFRKGIESCCTLQVIPTGHQVLHEKNAELILNLLQS